MKKRFIPVILIVLFILLYEHFFIASTMEQAMDKQGDPGRQFITTIIDDKNAVTFTDTEVGVIRATTLSKGAFGWLVKDQMEIVIPIDSKEGFIEKGEILDLKSGKRLATKGWKILHIGQLPIVAMFYMKNDWFTIKVNINILEDSGVLTLESFYLELKMNGANRSMKFTIENMNEISASEILRWQYEVPYDFYNNEHDAEAIKELLENNYSVVLNENREVVGFFCVGRSAQVPLGEKVGAYTEDIIDIGLGMAPALTGKGNGLIFFSFVLESLCKTYGHVPIRLTVATFNNRAINLYEKCGFIKEMEFTTDSAEFQTMRRDSLCLDEEI